MVHGHFVMVGLGLRPPCRRPWVTLSWPLGSLRSNCPKLEFLKNAAHE
jgi:hypothetical protein